MTTGHVLVKGEEELMKYVNTITSSCTSNQMLLTHFVLVGMYFLGELVGK